MDEMRDSTAMADNIGALLQEIRAEGYVLLRGLVDPDVAAAAGDEVRALLAKHGFTTGADGSEEVLRTPVKGQETADYWAMYAEVLALESLNALPHRSQRLVDTMRAILGPTAFTYPMKTCRLVFPQVSGGAAIPLHRDNRGGPWVRDMFTTWVALGRIDAAMGGFAMLRGSQTYRYQAIREDGGGPPTVFGDRIPELDSPEWVSTEWEPGDVVLFHCYTLHRGIYNRSPRIRISADFRWQATDHPVQVSALLPYHYLDKYPNIPGWPQLTANWSDHRWCEYPGDATITHDKWPEGHGFTIPASKYVDVEPGAHEAWRAAIRDKSLYKVPFELPN